MQPEEKKKPGRPLLHRSPASLERGLGEGPPHRASSSACHTLLLSHSSPSRPASWNVRALPSPWVPHVLLGPLWGRSRGRAGLPRQMSSCFLRSSGPSVYINPRTLTSQPPDWVSFRLKLTVLRLQGPHPASCTFCKHTLIHLFHLGLSNYAAWTLMYSPNPFPQKSPRRFLIWGLEFLLFSPPALARVRPGSRYGGLGGRGRRGLKGVSLAQLPGLGRSSSRKGGVASDRRRGNLPAREAVGGSRELGSSGLRYALCLLEPSQYLFFHGQRCSLLEAMPGSW